MRKVFQWTLLTIAVIALIAATGETTNPGNQFMYSMTCMGVMVISAKLVGKLEKKEDK